jgi:hypothetical protein
MATLTALAAQTGAQPKGHHVGVQSITSTFSLSAALSAGDQMLMAKIESGTRILGVLANFGGGSGNDVVVNVGLTGTLSALGSATAAAGIAWLAKGVPLLVSLSDDASPRYTYLTLSFPTVTSTTNVGAISLTVLLTRDLEPKT